MNKYEQALVDAVRQITKDNAARAASDARWLNGMLRDLAPQVIGQREYKMLTALLNCEGNRILAEAAKKPAAARDALLHTMACKAAIKGGWKSDLSELRVLVDKVQSGEVQFCPHGRPVKAKLTKYELEKMFKRA